MAPLVVPVMLPMIKHSLNRTQVTQTLILQNMAGTDLQSLNEFEGSSIVSTMSQYNEPNCTNQIGHIIAIALEAF